MAPMIFRGRRIDVADVDTTLDSAGTGNGTVTFQLDVNSYYSTAYSTSVSGQSLALVSVDRDNEDDGLVPIYVTNGPADTTVTITVVRFASDESI